MGAVKAINAASLALRGDGSHRVSSATRWLPSPSSRRCTRPGAT
jgi:hypothetical protein